MARKKTVRRQTKTKKCPQKSSFPNILFDIGGYKGSIKKTKKGYAVKGKKKGFFDVILD